MKHFITLLLFCCLVSLPSGAQVSVSDLQKAAQNGNAAAQHDLGNCYYFGKGVTQSYAEAARWFRKAADQGDADAQFNLGVCYEIGEGVTQSYAEAARWYRKAADQGDAKAQFNLGVCYEKGEGVAQSYTEAAKWYRKAADQGYADAQFILGNCYYFGEGVTQSYAEAARWYRKAADQGDAKAEFALNLILDNDRTEVSEENSQTKSTTSTATTTAAPPTSSLTTSASTSAVPSTTTTYSPKQKTHRRSYPFNTPYWETRPWGFSIGYVQKQWVYKTLPEYASELGSIVERYGVFSEDGEAKVANGLQVGIRYEPQFQYGFGLNTGIFYEGYYDKSNDYSDSEGNYNLEWLEHSINIPFHVEFRANFKEGFQFFVYGGASVDVGISSTITFHDLSSGYDYEPIDIYGDKYEMKRFNASWEAGAGLRFYGIQLQGQFSRGLINMASHGSDYSVMQDKPLSISLSFMF